ncbi:glycosyltransferase family 1 protein [Mesorhizobium sp. KR2-14]|uniref:glycosyltransferase family 4 protein n=1 Tax=Mesorhizobium sp. KR2-14 TaxID=3156610 RepID=UPI0032B4759E
MQLSWARDESRFMQSGTVDQLASLPQHCPAPSEARGERFLIVTDAWHPQINGVVRTLERLAEELEAKGCVLEFLTPQDFGNLPLPFYAEIRLALATPARVAKHIRRARPDHVHIATEGPLGMLARRFCLRHGLAFTTSYHTRFPEYLSARAPVPERWSYAWLSRFHNAGNGTLVATPSLAAELTARGFRNVRPWTRGVDTGLYRPDRPQVLGDLPRPIFLSVGRVAVEKNLPAFLDLDLPGSKVVVGDGPDLKRLRTAYPDAVFLGAKTGEELADIYASADVFVFPSRTDTFGIVLLEALASGLPVAAFPVTGPIDVLGDGLGGALSPDLRQAALEALAISRNEARAKALTYSWASCADIFLEHAGAAHIDAPDTARKPSA